MKILDFLFQPAIAMFDGGTKLKQFVRFFFRTNFNPKKHQKTLPTHRGAENRNTNQPTTTV